jgi:ribonuclease VapC
LTILADASAVVAIMAREPGHGALMDRIASHNDRLYCAVGVWEAVRALARIRKGNVADANNAVTEWLEAFGFRRIPIGEQEERIAVDAHRRYGKGTGHPARLNMGDCFAYACAKANDAKLLYKGDDFSHTDLA